MKHARNNSSISNKNRINILEEYVNQLSGETSQISKEMKNDEKYLQMVNLLNSNTENNRGDTTRINDINETRKTEKNEIKEELFSIISNMQILGNYIKGLEKRVTALEEHNKTSDVGQVCEKNLIFTKEFIPQDSFQREIDAFSKKMEVCIADVYLAIKNSEDQLAINIEESNTLFRIDINHLDNQIKRIEKHVNEIMQISNSEVYDTSHLQCSHNNKQLMREGIYESFTNGDDVSLNTVILQESNKIEDLFRKHNRTEKVIEEVLKQLNSTKRNLASFKDESTKVSDEHSNQLKLHIQRFSTHESKVVKDLESLSDKLSALKKENSSFKLKLIEKEKEAKDMSISVIDELKQNFERTSKLSKDITDHITTFEITVKAIWDSFGLLSDSINSNV